MAKKQKYTTILIKADAYQSIRDFCKRNAVVISGRTEWLWLQHISASLTGSAVI